MQKGLYRFIKNCLNPMGKGDEIPTYFIVLLSSITGIVIGFFLLFLVTDNPLLFILDNFAGERIFYLYFLGLVIGSALIGFGLAFSSKNGN